MITQEKLNRLNSYQWSFLTTFHSYLYFKAALGVHRNYCRHHTTLVMHGSFKFRPLPIRMRLTSIEERRFCSRLYIVDSVFFLA